MDRHRIEKLTNLHDGGTVVCDSLFAILVDEQQVAAIGA